MIVFIDKLFSEMIYLQNTLRVIDAGCKFVVIEDDFFLPNDAISIREYLHAGKACMGLQQKELYYAFVDLPDFWKVQPESWKGAIYDLENKKATINFCEPIEKRIVKSIEWLSDNGNVYRVDYYNKYGYRECVELKDSNGNSLSKSYYLPDGKEMCFLDMVNGTVLIFEQGHIRDVFESSEYLERYAYEKSIVSEDLMIATSLRQLEVMDKVNENGEANICVLFNRMDEIQKYRERGYTYPVFLLNNARNVVSEKETPDGICRIDYCFDTVKDTNKHGDILILTMSDQIEHIEQLINNIPDVMFHIAANTLVSDKLLALEKYENVRIYPQISKNELAHLFEISSFYLDINHGYEIYDAVIEATKNGLLVLGFENSIHNPYYILEELVFAKNDVCGLIDILNKLIKNSNGLSELLIKQKDKIKQSMNGFISMMDERR